MAGFNDLTKVLVKHISTFLSKYDVLSSFVNTCKKIKKDLAEEYSSLKPKIKFKDLYHLDEEPTFQWKGLKTYHFNLLNYERSA